MPELPASPEPLAEITTLYTVVEKNYNRLFFATKDAQARQELRDGRDRAKAAYDAALLKAFDETDPAVAGLTHEVCTVNSVILKDIEHLDKVQAVIGLIGKAAGLVAKLVTLV